MITVVSKLPPEFQTALGILQNIQNEDFNELQPAIWKETGFCAHAKKKLKIREIPSGSQWKWNQAKKRYTIASFNGESNTNVELTKLVPRKSVNSTLNKLPKLKLWLGIISNDIKEYSVLWCEKGIDFSPIESPELNIDDYVFLADFMDDECSKEFWPHLSCKSGKEWDEYFNSMFI